MAQGILHIMLVLCSMLVGTYYAQHYVCQHNQQVPSNENHFYGIVYDRMVLP